MATMSHQSLKHRTSELVAASRETRSRTLEGAQEVAKKIGKALEAKLVVRVPACSRIWCLQKARARAYAELFGVSQVELESTADPAARQTMPSSSVRPSLWRKAYAAIAAGATPAMSAREGMYPSVCARCADALEKIGFAPDERGAARLSTVLHSNDAATARCAAMAVADRDAGGRA